MAARRPAVAGPFYPADEGQCRAELRRYVGRAAPSDANRISVAAIVPHAGWICSGAVAGETFACLLADFSPETIVVFGTAHARLRRLAALDACDEWQTPLGPVGIDRELTEALVSASADVEIDPRPHQQEHSIEVQVPFIQMLCPQAKLLPILLVTAPAAVELGRTVARLCRESGREVAIVGSTDLTHYGPGYSFTPHGAGADGFRWAKEVNDQRIIDLCMAMDADRVVPEAIEHRNACGAGAIAATITAAQALGADHATLCRHTTSAEVLGERPGTAARSVGYAGICFTKPVTH